MPTVRDPRYIAEVQKLARELRLIHRNAGEPSLEALARKMGYSKATMSRVLSGRTLPRGAWLQAFLEALTLSEKDVLGRLIELRSAAREIVAPVDAPTGNGEISKNEVTVTSSDRQVAMEQHRDGDEVVWAQDKFDARRSA